MAVPKLPLFSLSWWVGGLIRRKTAQLALTHFKWKLVIVLRGWGTNPITIKLWENPIQNLRSQKELKIEIKTQKLRMISFFFFFSRSSLFFLFPPCSALSSPSTEIQSSKHIVTIGHMSNRQRTTYIKTILATIQPNPTHLWPFQIHQTWNWKKRGEKERVLTYDGWERESYENEVLGSGAKMENGNGWSLKPCFL